VVVLAVELDDHAMLGPVGVDEDTVDADADTWQRDVPSLTPGEEVVFERTLVRARRG
jgi:hypothetical protein